MRLTLLLPLLVSVSISSSDYRQALSLYENGMYERARTMFEELPDSPLNEGYVVLCALKMRTADYQELLADYSKKYPSSVLTHPIAFENAGRLFDGGDYKNALSYLSSVDIRALPRDRRPEYYFKLGYCNYVEGLFPEALKHFATLDADYSADFSAPARYLSGVMKYNSGNFEEAEGWFKKAVNDHRFTELCNFYVVDCEFNRKNYDFVIEEGGKLFSSVPKERQEHLARIISESYLVRGEKQKAREYYDSFSSDNMTRSDYFYAGSVMYGVEDYAGAIENFSKMTNRTDSLGQIANYQMGNSYIRLRNKVAALDAFRDAAMVEFDPEITEDAYFNYAKLAFDLNKDTDGFTGYIKRWSTRAKGEQIYSYMALAALVDRDYASAIEAYDNIDVLSEDMRQNYAKANYLRAEQLVRNSSWRDAMTYLRASSFYIPKNEKFNQLARFWLAESNYRTENYPEARKIFTDLYNESALEGMTESGYLPYNVACCYLNEGDFVSAARWFDLSADSGNPALREDSMIRRADCDFVSKDYKAAIKSYGKVIEEFGKGDDAYPYYRQAMAYGLSGDRKRKVSVLKEVLGKGAGTVVHDEAVYELGRTQMDLKNNTDALETFNLLRNTSSNPTYVARALIGLGMVSRNVSQYDQALDYYKEVVSAMPGTEYSKDALLAIESIYQAQKQPQKYLEYVEENSLVGDSADREEMYFSTAEKIYLAGNWQQAVSSIRKYIEMFPQGKGMNRMLFYLADSYNSLGEKEKACDAYARVMELETSGSFAEISTLKYSSISYSLERFKDAYRGYASLLAMAEIDANRKAARLGMMRSAYRDKDFVSAISAAGVVRNSGDIDADEKREADYILGKSYMAGSKRDQALAVFRELSVSSNTPEGAEARYILLQDAFDRGNFESVETMVYEFSKDAGDQYYWLAKSYLVLGDSFVERGKMDEAKACYESILEGYSPEAGNADDIADTVRAKLERIEKLNG